MHKKSIELLNKSVADELSAVHQYMYFHFHADDQGFKPIAGMFKRIAVEEMMHVERLAERILFLGGDVEMVLQGEVKKIQDIKEMLECARGMEESSAMDYNKFAIECSQNADSATKSIFESLVADEERHYEMFDQQLENIARFGDKFLALQSFDAGGSAPAE
jgi:bacterioferritin